MIEKSGAKPTVVMTVEIMRDGDVVFSTLKSYNFDVSDFALTPESFNITSYISRKTTIRFRASGGATAGHIYFDDIAITATGAGGCTAGDDDSGDKPYTDYSTLTGADQLHAAGITGSGVAVVVLDTGFFTADAIKKNTSGQYRLLAHYDAINDQLLGTGTSDENGHGAHLSGIILNSELGTAAGKRNGIAPDADLVAIKAFGPDGFGTYLDVITGLDWAVANKDAYNIQVLNLSIAAPVRSYYWDDPLNQAVMAAWDAGLVVVVSAGNTGPDPDDHRGALRVVVEDVAVALHPVVGGVRVEIEPGAAVALVAHHVVGRVIDVGRLAVGPAFLTVPYTNRFAES